MEVKQQSANQTLLSLIIETIDLDIQKSLNICNKWQKSRMESEKLVFGKSVTRLLTEADIRSARSFLYQKKGGR